MTSQKQQHPSIYLPSGFLMFVILSGVAPIALPV